MMNTKNKKSRKENIKNSHLIYVFIFFLAFTIRYFGSQELPINSYEASILLKITDQTFKIPIGISFIESFLIKFTLFIFGESNLAARIWPIIAGSILTLLPLYLRKIIDSKYGILISIFIAIDPFMIANSIQIGSNIYAFLVISLLFAAIWKRDMSIAILNLIFLFFSGRGSVFAIIFSIIIVFYLKVYNADFLEDIRQEFMELWREKNTLRFPGNLIFGLLLVFGVILVKSDISLMLNDVIKNIENVNQEYIMGESPLAFGVVLLSYLPFYSFIILYWLSKMLIRRNRPKYLPFLFCIITLVFILFNPNHKFFDLLWVSAPLLIYSALITPNIVSLKAFSNTSNLIKTTIFLVLIIALSINFSRFIYMGYSGLSQNETVISQIIILIGIALFVVFLIYQYNNESSFHTLINAAIIFVFFVQLGFSFRASGLSGSRYKEFMWAGASFDSTIVQKIVESKDLSIESSGDDVKIGLINIVDPGILWDLRELDVSKLNETEKRHDEYDILISRVGSIEETNERFYGQEFIAKAFPGWSIKPIRSLKTYDYWSWLIFRKSQMQKSFNYIWIKTG